ncbi:YhdP family protein [Inhella sp.]|uniref:YhdP family protein n=1 Tax=Inhella sp. TaxID=1921806 RepID=UPI0035AF08F3
MSSLVSKLVAASHRPGRWARRALRWLLTGLAVLWLLLLALWLLLHGVILPSADRWRPDIEAAASRALGISMRIGRIEVQTGGWMPVLALHDIRLRDAADREALQLPRVMAMVSARSLLAWPPRLEQISIDTPQLELRRDRQGRLWAAGLPLVQGRGEDSPAADWLLRQHEVALRGGRLTWVDEMDARQGAVPLQLVDVQALLRNGLRRHDLRIDVTPPPELGARLSLRAQLRQPLLAKPSDWRRWSGTVYAELPRTGLAALRERVSLPLALVQGEGGLRAWGELREGALRDLTLDLQLDGVRLQLSPGVDPLELQQLRVRAGWQAQRDGSRWSLSGLRFSLPADEPGLSHDWPASQATMTLRHREALAPWQLPSALEGGSFEADRLDLALLARLAGGLPLPTRLRELLREREPQGLMRGLQAHWQGTLEAPTDWRVAGEAEQLAWRPGPLPEATAELPYPIAAPGLQGVALRFSATAQGGQALLRLQDGQLVWPGLLVGDALLLRSAELPLSWRREAQGWHMQWTDARLQGEDLQLSLEGHWQQTAQPGGRLEMRARAPQARVDAVPRYLPRLLGLETRQYLGDALQGGELRDLRLELRGALADFPFRQPQQGVFRVSARVRDGRYAYLPSHAADATRAAYQSPWPGFEALQGEIRFENAGMQLRIDRGRSAGLEVSDVQLRIPDLGRDPRLLIDGQWRGDAGTALAFVRATPVNGWTHGALAQAQALAPIGAATTVSGQLQLAIPILEPARSTVRGRVQLPTGGLSLRLRDDLPAFSQLRGQVDFTDHSVQLPRLQARFLGGELSLRGGSRADGGALLLEAEGQASSEGLRAAVREWPGLALLAPHLAGQTDYQLRLEFKGEQPELELRSSLQGLVARLPEPLGKRAEQTLPLLLRVQPQAGGREVWGLQLGSGAQTALLALLEREGLRTRRGAIRMGGEGELPLPAQGVQVVWAAPQIDLDPWRRLHEASEAGNAQASASSEPAWLPDRVELQAAQLRIAQRRLHQVQATLRLAPNRQDWRLQLRAAEAQGEVDLRRPSGQPMQVQARFQRLAVPQGEAERVEQYLEQAVGALPGLDVAVDDFELRGKKLGRLRIQADGAPAGRDWTLQELSLQHPEAQLQARGAWLAAERRTRLDWTLDVADSGRWLDALGYTQTVRGGKGQLAGQLSWPGSPLSPSAEGLAGQFSVLVQQGQFLKADPGVARLLGILSLQSLPRRLLFDWRDVFSSGFLFDEVAGDVQVAAGKASTRNLRLRGLQANVLMEGSADLAAETADLRVLVVPNLDAGGASLAYTAINPAVGLTAFLAQWLLKGPIQEANTTELRVHGPWTDPRVERVERKPAAAASAASARR